MSISTSLLVEAFRPLAGVFGDGMTADSVGSKFTCSEANDIALALHVSGHEEAAVTWLLGHAEGEDWDDLHAHEYDETQGDRDRDQPRLFDEDEIRDYLRDLAADYLDALRVMAAS
ncbi:hypothetical protein [Streptomyces sp. NPDC048623]|uniref:hypothetical protein n=1 Tax=Streptomyces sp. NPDC048623 TaxID=3155761 RepID=UPI0034455ABE